MHPRAIGEVWVCADNPVAVDFYRGCGLTTEVAQPVYLTRAIRKEEAPISSR